MKKMRLLVLALCAAGLFQGCGDHSSGTTSAASQKKLKLAFVANGAGDFWSFVRLGCDSGMRPLENVDLDFRFLADRTAAAQQEMVSNLVASGVDGIAISPIDPDGQADFLNSVAAKTLLVCVNSDAEKSKRAGFIGSDSIAAGAQAAELLKTALPHGGKICLFVGYTNAHDAKDRIQGMQKALENSNVQIMDTLVDDGKVVIAQKNAEDALKKYPDVAGMVGLYAYDGPAILTAVRSAGKAGQVKIVCFDENNDTLAGIAAGDIYGTIVQSPYKFGQQTVTRMEKYLRGDKTQFAGEKIIIPTHPVTSTNVWACQEALKILE